MRVTVVMDDFMASYLLPLMGFRLVFQLSRVIDIVVVCCRLVGCGENLETMDWMVVVSVCWRVWWSMI